MPLKIKPCHLRAAREYVSRYHRHSIPPVGGKFAVACYDGVDLALYLFVQRGRYGETDGLAGLLDHHAHIERAGSHVQHHSARQPHEAYRAAEGHAVREGGGSGAVRACRISSKAET